MASRVKPTLTDAELVDIFMGTLQGLYYEKMVGSSSSNFGDMVTIGERIENGLKTRKIASIDSQSVAKKSQGFAKKKEVEASAVMANVYPQFQVPMDLMPYYPYPYICTAHYQQPVCQSLYQQPPQAVAPQNQQNNRNQSQGQGRHCDKKRPQHDQIPVSYTQLLPYLVQQGAIVPKEIPPVVHPYGLKYNPNASCAFHAGYIGHSTEDYGLFKTRVQELID